MTRRPWLVLAVLLLMPLASEARGYTPQGRCGDYARLDIRNGAATLEPCVEAIRSYPVKVDGGRVWVEID